MGIATDALLVYGINIGDDLAWVVTKVYPGAYPEDTDWEAVLEAALPKCLELRTVGHVEGPAWIISGKSIVVHRGYEKEVKALPKPSPTALKALRLLSRKLKLHPCVWLAGYADF